MLLASVGHSNSRLGRVASIRGDARVVNNIEVASIAVDWRKIRSEVNMTIVLKVWPLLDLLDRLHEG